MNAQNMLKITFYKKYTLQLIISVCVLLLNTYSATAQVVVTSAGTVNMCVGGAYVTIPAFKVAEKLNTDFAASGSLQTYELSAPSDFEFNPGTGTVAIPATTDISFATLEVTATKITLLYFLNTTAQKDSFIFNGLQVRAVTTNSANDLRFTGGTASQNQNNLNQYAHAHFNSANANVSLSVSTNIVCTNGSDITLNGSPSGGAYTGSTGISGNTFKPAIAGVGSYVITYTATNNGCVGTDTVHIAVKEAPSVTFFGLASTYCSNDSIDKPLTGFPAGGTFSGSGITNSTFFNPKSAGVGNNKTITYQYSANGCQSSSTSQTNVLVAPSITISLNPDKNNFFTTDTVLIDGNPSYLSPGGTLTVTGDGVVTNVVGQSKFYPGVIGQGTSTITRTITTSNGCSATAKKTVTVISSSGGQIGGIADTVCQSANQITMTVNNDQGYYYVYYYNPSFGYTLDANAYIDTDHTNGIGVFIPTKASIGTYLIEFIGNNFGLAYTYVQVIGPPAVTIINIKPSYCSDASQFAIQYTTTGNGIVAFSGNGVNNKQFNPGAITSFNVPTVISYTYTDVTGCNSAGTVNTTIFQAPQNVGFTNLNSSYCDKDPNSPIIVNTNITPVGGVGIFSGIGVDTSNNTVLFNPSSAALFNGSQSSKNYSISFTYTTTNGCAATSSKTVAVNKLPDVHLCLYSRTQVRNTRFFIDCNTRKISDFLI